MLNALDAVQVRLTLSKHSEHVCACVGQLHAYLVSAAATKNWLTRHVFGQAMHQGVSNSQVVQHMYM
jgi:hypothetical protein